MLRNVMGEADSAADRNRPNGIIVGESNGGDLTAFRQSAIFPTVLLVLSRITQQIFSKTQSKTCLTEQAARA